MFMFGYGLHLTYMISTEKTFTVQIVRLQDLLNGEFIFILQITYSVNECFSVVLFSSKLSLIIQSLT